MSVELRLTAMPLRASITVTAVVESSPVNGRGEGGEKEEGRERRNRRRGGGEVEEDKEGRERRKRGERGGRGEGEERERRRGKRGGE